LITFRIRALRLTMVVLAAVPPSAVTGLAAGTGTAEVTIIHLFENYWMTLIAGYMTAEQVQVARATTMDKAAIWVAQADRATRDMGQVAKAEPTITLGMGEPGSDGAVMISCISQSDLG